MLSNRKKGKGQKVVLLFLIVSSNILLLYLFFSAIKQVPKETVVTMVEEEVGLYDMGIYKFDISSYKNSLIRFRSGQLENGEYQSTFFCIVIEDSTYIDPNCATGGQYELFRIEYVTEGYIVPEYNNEEVVLNFEEGSDFPNLMLFWDDTPEMLLEQSPILQKAKEDGIIEIVRTSFVLP